MFQNSGHWNACDSHTQQKSRVVSDYADFEKVNARWVCMLVFLVINISHMSKPIPMVPINGYNRAGTYLLKFNSRNTKKRCGKCSKLTMKTPDRRSGVFIVNFEHISRLVLVFLLLTLKMELPLATCYC